VNKNQWTTTRVQNKKESIMNKHLIVSLVAGTTAVLCGIAQEQPDRRQNFTRKNQQSNSSEEQVNQQGPQRGPLSEVPGQMPKMRGMDNQGRPTPGEPPPRRLFADPEALKAAGATDEQLQTFRKFMQEQRLKQVDMRAAVEKAELTLQILESDEKSKEDDLLKATEKVSLAKADMLKQETLMKIKVKEIFGEEVVKKVFEANQKKQSQRPQQPQGPDEQRQGQPRKGSGQRPQPPAGPAEK
jgi:hypothetical protein